MLMLHNFQKVSDLVGLPPQQPKPSINLLQRMSQNASKLLLSKEAGILQVTSDMVNLHNSAEQLMQPSGKIGPGKNPLQFSSFTNNYSSLIEKQSSSGRDVSPVTTASLMPPDSTIFSLANDPAAAITIE